MKNCPQCASERTVKNGYIHNGKQKYLCRDCGRQFVLNPQNRPPISAETKALIQRLLLERVSLAGIARVVRVSESWLQEYVNQLYQDTPRQVEITPPMPEKKSGLTLECDEMWSFVGNKKNKVWLWLALDRDSRRIVAAYVGDRSRAGAQQL